MCARARQSYAIRAQIFINQSDLRIYHARVSNRLQTCQNQYFSFIRPRLWTAARSKDRGVVCRGYFARRGRKEKVSSVSQGNPIDTWK